MREDSWLPFLCKNRHNIHRPIVDQEIIPISQRVLMESRLLLTPVRRQGTNIRAKSHHSYITVHHAVYGKEGQAMHYSILIQGSPSNGMFEWINPYKYRNPYITSMNILFRPNQVMFNNVDTTNIVTNSGGEEVTISPGYYTLSEIIAILNTMNNTSFSISTMATSYGCI